MARRNFALMPAPGFSRSPASPTAHRPCSVVMCRARRSACYVALATAAALFGKEASGTGQVVDVSAPQCLASLAEQVWVEYSASGEMMERMGSRGGITAVAGALPCADGHWMISVPPDPRGWANFVQLVPHPAFKDDGTLADEAMRRENASRRFSIASRNGRRSKGRTRSSSRRKACISRRLRLPIRSN